MLDFWNDRYGTDNYAYGVTPKRYPGLPVGLALT